MFLLLLGNFNLSNLIAFNSHRAMIDVIFFLNSNDFLVLKKEPNRN